MERRCSKCKQTKNLKSSFYRYKRGRGGYQAQCKDCMGRYKRATKPVAKKVMYRERETGFRVLECPGRVYSPGAEFSRNDFLESLVHLVWPNGMTVKDIASKDDYMVRGKILMLIEIIPE